MNCRYFAVLTLAAASLANAQPLFTRLPGPSFNAGAGPYSAITADLNQDGIPDLAFADYGSSTITVLLGDGKGGFTPAPGSPYPAGGETLAVAAGDFNGDGFTDLVGLSFLAGPMYIGQGANLVLFGDGRGGFSPVSGPSFPVRPSQLTRGFPIYFAAADLNLDGKTDLVMRNADSVWALLSDGAGGFNIAPGSPFTAAHSGIAIADFNRDGRPDIAVSDFSAHTITVFRGDGSGRFQPGPQTTLPANMSPLSMVVADWNDDRIQDLAVAFETGKAADSSGIAFLTGDGTGAFQLRSTFPFSVEYKSQPFSVLDINGDGFPDLYVTNGAASILLLGAGDASFTLSTDASFPNELGVVLAADYNQDGKPDVADSHGFVSLNSLPAIPVSRTSVSIEAALNGPGPRPVPLTVGPVPGLSARTDQNWVRFVNSQVMVDPAGFGPAGLTPGHHDAILRLSAPGYYGVTVPVGLNVAAPSGALRFQSFEPEPLLPLGDFNNDGKLDLLRLNEGGLSVLLNDGTAHFQDSALRFPLTLGSGGQALGDFDGDGNLDVAIVGQNGVSFYSGDGSGALRPARPTAIQSDASAFQLIVKDFNGDGYLDIVSASASQQPLQLFLGDGHGNFREVSNPAPSLPASPAQIVVGDLNHDGKLDLAMSFYQLGTVYLLMGDGTGRFQISQTLTFGPNSLPSIAAGDWNSDGKLDLAVRNWAAETDSYLTFFSGSGTGQLTKASELRFSQPRLTGGLTAADVDGDGNLDLLAGLGTNSIVLLLGDGTGNFSPAPGGPIGEGNSAVAADLNGDGRTSVLLRGADRFGIYLGGRAVSVTALSRDAPNPFLIGQTVSFTASLTASPGAFRTPAGTVSLFDGSTLAGTALLTGGQAKFLVPYSPGVHQFRALYDGDARFSPSVAPLTVVETGTPATIVSLGSTQPFRVTVTDSNGNPIGGLGVLFTAPC